MAAAPAHLRHTDSFPDHSLAPLPSELHEIAERIEASWGFVRTDGDDDEGYDLATWQRAARLVGDTAVSYWRTRRAVPPPPVISDGPDGVVDILWKHASLQVLLTIHPEPDDVATFYGRDLKTGGDVVRGELALNRDNEWLLVWLTK